MKNFCTGSGKSVGFVVAQLMEEAGFGGFVRIGGVDAIDVGPDDEFFGVHDVSDDGSGKIGAIAAEGGDATVGSGADKSGDYGDDAFSEEREENRAAALAGLFEMRLGVAEIVAGDDKVRGRDRNRHDAGFLQGRGEEARAEAFSKRRETIEKLGIGSDAAFGGHLVKQIAAEKLDFPADAEFVVLFQMQVLQDFEVERQESLDFAAGVSELSICKSVGDGKKMIGDALHRGDDYRDIRGGRGAADQTRGVEHTLRAEQRAAAKLEGHNIKRLGDRRASAVDRIFPRGASPAETHAAIRCFFILNIFEAHDLRSWFFSKCDSGVDGADPLERLWRGG
jgi:hypothetical protein